MNVVLDDITYDYIEIGLDKYDFIQKLEDMKPAQIISLLTNAPLDMVKKAPFADVKFVSNVVKNSFYEKFYNTPLELTYTHKGKHYGLIIPSRISFEEWINLEVMIADDKLNLPLIASHLYKPLSSDKQGEDRELMEYSYQECEKRAKEDFSNFPLRIFNSALFFFTSFVMEYTKNILSSLEMKETEQNQEKNINQEKQNNLP